MPSRKKRINLTSQRSGSEGYGLSASLHGNSNFKALCLSLLLFLVPAVNTFGFFEVVAGTSTVQINTYVNLVSFILILFCTLISPLGFSKRLVRLVIVFIACLVVNLIFTDYASTKWFFNWFGFLIIFAFVYQAFLRIDKRMIEKLSKYSENNVLIVFSFLGLMSTYTWGANLPDLMSLIQFGKTNHIIALLSANVGIEKQALGSLGAILLLTIIFLKTRLMRTRYLLLLAALVILLPALIGIRTLILSLTLFALCFFTFKSSWRAISVSIFFGGALVIYLFLESHSLTTLVEKHYDRWNSLLAAVEIFISKPLGIGNGGYHFYVEKHNDFLLANFGSDSMLKTNSFWLAPESDLVYFIASWGILSVLFFSLSGYVIYVGVRLLHRCRYSMKPIEKLILSFTSTLFLMGVSQDNAGSLVWWIYLGASMGIIERYQKKEVSKGVSYPRVY